MVPPWAVTDRGRGLAVGRVGAIGRGSERLRPLGVAELPFPSAAALRPKRPEVPPSEEEVARRAAEGDRGDCGDRGKAAGGGCVFSALWA